MAKTATTASSAKRATTGGDTVIVIDGDNTLTLVGVQLSALHADDFVFA